VRDRRGRFARGRSGNPADRPRSCRDRIRRAAGLLLAGERQLDGLAGQRLAFAEEAAAPSAAIPDTAELQRDQETAHRSPVPAWAGMIGNTGFSLSMIARSSLPAGVSPSPALRERASREAGVGTARFWIVSFIVAAASWC